MPIGRAFKWTIPIVSVGGSAVAYRFIAGNGQEVGLISPETFLTGSGISNSDRVEETDPSIPFNEPMFDSTEVNGNSISTVSAPQTATLSEISEVTPTSHQNLQEQIRLETERKEKIRKEAKEALDKMNDYTFRIFSPCSVGTGWVLDYQIPENKNEYPTVWYIATNAHVIEDYRFLTNPYKQEMNISTESTEKLRSKYWRMRLGYLSLWKDGTCDPVSYAGYFDLSLSKESTGKKLTADKGMVHNNHIEEPKLFYLATNFLNKNENLGVPENNYKDFAVLEIKFNNSEYARQVTDGFADKYKVDSTEAINIFADPFEKLKDLEEENFYNLGYPGQFQGEKKKFQYSNNFNKDTARAARLSGQVNGIKGVVSAKEAGKDWAGIARAKVGNFYLVEQDPKYHLRKGSSGSMFIDKDWNLLGIKSIGGDAHSFLVPLRSKEIKSGQLGNLVSPAYDLIVGVEGQKSSYKKQVEEFVLKNKKKTWLSERGWGHISKVP